MGLTVYGQLIIKAHSLAHATGVVSSHKIDYLIAMFTDIGVLSYETRVICSGWC